MNKIVKGATTSQIKMTRYWLLKSEPDEYSIEQLETNGTGRWDGIRNYQARNLIREMNVNDVAFFYHSSCAHPGIFGSLLITSTSYPDPTAVEKGNKYFDKRIKDDNNPWASVDIQFKERFTVPLLLPQIKELKLGPCPLTARGNRLSVIPLTDDQFALLERELVCLNDSG
jgi:predicted RNA-binding protein with PUA-like domain